jgi:hypothetical protein
MPLYDNDPPTHLDSLDINIRSLRNLLPKNLNPNDRKSVFLQIKTGRLKFNDLIEPLGEAPDISDIQKLITNKMASTTDSFGNSAVSIRKGVLNNLELTRAFMGATHQHCHENPEDERLQALGSKIIRASYYLVTGQNPSMPDIQIPDITHDVEFLNTMASTYQKPKANLLKLTYKNPQSSRQKPHNPTDQHYIIEHNLNIINQIASNHDFHFSGPRSSPYSIRTSANTKYEQATSMIEDSWKYLRDYHVGNASLRITAASQLITLALIFDRAAHYKKLGPLQSHHESLKVSVDSDAAWLLTRAKQQINGIRAVDNAVDNLRSDYVR